MDEQPEQTEPHAYVPMGDQTIMADTRTPPSAEPDPEPEAPQDQVVVDNFEQAVRGTPEVTIELGGKVYKCVDNLNPMALADWQIMLAEIATLSGQTEEQIRKDPSKLLKLTKLQKDLVLMVEWVVHDDVWPEVKQRLYDKNGGLSLPELAGSLGKVVQQYSGMGTTKR